MASKVISSASSTADDIEVRLADQEQITEFGRLNTRLLELRAECKQMQSDIEKLDDATSELSMVIGGKVMVFIGESFVECTEDYANEYCEKKVESLKQTIAERKEEESTILTRQNELKKILYARFGDSINLEN